MTPIREIVFWIEAFFVALFVIIFVTTIDFLKKIWGWIVSPTSRKKKEK